MTAAPARSSAGPDEILPEPAAASVPEVLARPADPAAPDPTTDECRRRFHVRLDNFDGPFDLLLQLINQRRMDVTEVALHQVTDDFIAHVKAMGEHWDLDQVTEFLVIAATLLDLKAARLLPDAIDDAAVDDDMFQARDLLFARLLAYRAYQQVATLFAELEAGALRRYPRAVSLEARYLGLLPEIRIGMTPEQFAAMAATVFRPKPPPTVNLDHIHTQRVSVAEHTAVLRAILAECGTATFADLVVGCTATLEVVARFLGLLNLYRESAVAFDQPEPLGTLTVRWTLPTETATATDTAATDTAATDTAAAESTMTVVAPIDEEYE